MPASSSAKRVFVTAATACSLGMTPVTGVAAQELVHTFRDPAFGGNPFNGDYLLAIANLSRPKEPEEPADLPTDDELLASQIRAQLSSTLSLTVINAIRTAKVGQSGSFDVGDQTISYTRTVQGTRVTFTNTKTGESSEIFLPDPAFTGASSAMSLASAGAAPARSAEQELAASVTKSRDLLGPPPL